MTALALAGAFILALAGIVTAVPGYLRAGLAAQAAGMALLGGPGRVRCSAADRPTWAFARGSPRRSGLIR